MVRPSASACECLCIFVRSDLHRALFDLIAAWGVESRGLLEEELSGRLERLQRRERYRDDHMCITHTDTHVQAFGWLVSTHTHTGHAAVQVTPRRKILILSERGNFPGFYMKRRRRALMSRCGFSSADTRRSSTV